jgi:hypothetical protein
MYHITDIHSWHICTIFKEFRVEGCWAMKVEGWRLLSDSSGFSSSKHDSSASVTAALRQFSIAVALPARAERTLLNFFCSCLTCAFFVRLNARGHAMKVELHSTFLACSCDWFFTWLKLVAPPARAKRLQWKMAFI